MEREEFRGILSRLSIDVRSREAGEHEFFLGLSEKILRCGGTSPENLQKVSALLVEIAQLYPRRSKQEFCISDSTSKRLQEMANKSGLSKSEFLEKLIDQDASNSNGSGNEDKD